jgi:hypothetical protein
LTGFDFIFGFYDPQFQEKQMTIILIASETSNNLNWEAVICEINIFLFHFSSQCNILYNAETVRCLIFLFLFHMLRHLFSTPSIPKRLILGNIGN